MCQVSSGLSKPCCYSERKCALWVINKVQYIKLFVRLHSSCTKLWDAQKWDDQTALVTQVLAHILHKASHLNTTALAQVAHTLLYTHKGKLTNRLNKMQIVCHGLKLFIIFVIYSESQTVCCIIFINKCIPCVQNKKLQFLDATYTVDMFICIM